MNLPDRSNRSPIEIYELRKNVARLIFQVPMIGPALARLLVSKTEIYGDTELHQTMLTPDERSDQQSSQINKPS